jgi:hypothetical protein
LRIISSKSKREKGDVGTRLKILEILELIIGLSVACVVVLELVGLFYF